MKLREQYFPVLVAMLFAFAGSVAAQVEMAAGRFISVTGDVRVLGSDGASRAAQRNGEFRQGESIVTGPNSLAQLRMTDGGAVSVRGESQLKLDTYRFTGTDDRNSSFFVSIVKGGFRTITGLIARSNRSNYRVSTSSATLGIRGTDFEVVHVLQPMKDAPAGTYNRVYDGVTTFQNRTGATILVSREQTAYIPLPSNLPPVLVPPPAGIFGKPTPVPLLSPETRRDGEGDSGRSAAPAVAGDAPAVQETTKSTPASAVAPVRNLSAPLLNPIDSPRVLTAPATTTISPTLISPILTAPLTTTTTIISPTTTTISPILTAPLTTTTTIISPTTTTISPILTAPTTTIQSAPILKR